MKSRKVLFISIILTTSISSLAMEDKPTKPTSSRGAIRRQKIGKDGMQSGGYYVLGKSVEVTDLSGVNTFTAHMYSKFTVRDVLTNGTPSYTIQFENIDDRWEQVLKKCKKCINCKAGQPVSNCLKPKQTWGKKCVDRSTVKKHDEYKLDKSYKGADINKSVLPSASAVTSGPLIVPFKYRTGDNSITGDATIGYYAGYSFEFHVPNSSILIPVTPFIAGGIGYVSVADGAASTESETSITWAVGILLSNWDSLNIGIVYGEDRVGDSDWEHEGDGWVSFMLGWEI